MPSKEQVLRLVRDGRSYEEAGAALGISPGLAYMIATGIPADGGDTVTEAQRARPGFQGSRTQLLVNPRTENPTVDENVQAWVRQRAAADDQMQAAARAAGSG